MFCIIPHIFQIFLSSGLLSSPPLTFDSSEGLFLKISLFIYSIFNFLFQNPIISSFMLVHLHPFNPCKILQWCHLACVRSVCCFPQYGLFNVDFLFHLQLLLTLALLFSNLKNNIYIQSCVLWGACFYLHCFLKNIYYVTDVYQKNDWSWIRWRCNKCLSCNLHCK